MDNPDTEPPLEVHHRDIEVLRAAIGGLPTTPAKEMRLVSEAHLKELLEVVQRAADECDPGGEPENTPELVRDLRNARVGLEVLIYGAPDFTPEDAALKEANQCRSSKPQTPNTSSPTIGPGYVVDP
jgi:hypothetical protein